MKTPKIPLGSRIQDLERLVITSLKETELVEHPHIYHGDLRKKDDPLSLSYKAAEVYRAQEEYFDPLIEIFPLISILAKKYRGEVEIKTDYNEATQIRTIRMRLEHCPLIDVMQFKHDILLYINRAVSEYLEQVGKRAPSKKGNEGARHDSYAASSGPQKLKKKRR